MEGTERAKEVKKAESTKRAETEWRGRRRIEENGRSGESRENRDRAEGV